jgi:hypothetical protein
MSGKLWRGLLSAAYLFALPTAAFCVEAKGPAPTGSAPPAPAAAEPPKVTAPTKSKTGPPAPDLLCIYNSQQYSTGAAICVSQKIWMICNPPDKTHNGAWWTAAPQDLCLPSLRFGQ